MADRTWSVADAEAGLTLDKFLAAPDRMGSRSRAAAARERGKVFLNGAEAGQADVRLRLKAGDEIRVWEDRPGSARRRAAPFTSGPLRILYEDQFLIVLDKPAGLSGCPSRAARRGGLDLRSDRRSSAVSRKAEAPGRASDRSRHVRGRALRQGRAHARRVEAAVSSAHARAGVSRRRLRPSDSCVGNRGATISCGTRRR